MGEDEDEHIDADFGQLGWTCRRPRRRCRLYTKLWARESPDPRHCVPVGGAQSRDAKELTKEEATSLYVLATELAAANIVDAHIDLPESTVWCPCLRKELYVDLTAKRANGEFWNLSQEAAQQELVELQQEKRPDIIVGSPPCVDSSSLVSSPLSAEDGGGRHVDAAAEALSFCTSISLGASVGTQTACEEFPAADGRVNLVTGPRCRWKLKTRPPLRGLVTFGERHRG